MLSGQKSLIYSFTFLSYYVILNIVIFNICIGKNAYFSYGSNRREQVNEKGIEKFYKRAYRGGDDYFGCAGNRGGYVYGDRVHKQSRGISCD